MKNRINSCSSTFFLGKLSKTLLVHFSPSKRTLWPECHQNLYFVNNKRINTSVIIEGTLIKFFFLTNSNFIFAKSLIKKQIL